MVKPMSIEQCPMNTDLVSNTLSNTLSKLFNGWLITELKSFSLNFATIPNQKLDS